jgi:hypothetical protein
MALTAPLFPALRFGNNPQGSNKQDMPADCCARRKAGLPVPCCPPLPPEEIIPPAGDLVTLTLTAPKSKPTATPEPEFSKFWPLRVLQKTILWFKEFFSNLYQDVKHVIWGKPTAAG